MGWHRVGHDWATEQFCLQQGCCQADLSCLYGYRNHKNLSASPDTDPIFGHSLSDTKCQERCFFFSPSHISSSVRTRGVGVPTAPVKGYEKYSWCQNTSLPDPDSMPADSEPWSIGTEFPRVFPAQTDPGKALHAVTSTSVWASLPQVEEAHTYHTHRAAPSAGIWVQQKSWVREKCAAGPWLESLCSAACP